MTQSPVLILGMHRSGTSCLAGCLEAAGLFLGNVNTAAGFNKKGNRENRHLMELNDLVLEHYGASWDSPPPAPLEWPEDKLSLLKTYIDQFETSSLWGSKDPRTLFLLSGWREFTRPIFIGTFRSPDAVIRSLQVRAKKWKQDMSYEKALNLWISYNTQLLKQLEQHPFPLIHFGQDDNAYLSDLNLIGKKLNLDASKISEFYTNSLRNNDLTTSIPTKAQPIWNKLNQYSIDKSLYHN